MLPLEYRGAAFSCDPTGNLVRGDRLEKSGGTFAAHRIHERTEALRSRDNWFRPVFLADGPDGALYIADMYRKTIEHPEYLPAEVRRYTDFESGREQGRIWRLGSVGVAAGVHRSSHRVSMAKMEPRQLVEELFSEIPWRRDTAFRLLLEQRPANAVALLQKSKLNGGAGDVARLRLLENLGGVSEQILIRALEHPEAAVRQNAVLLAETRLLSDVVNAGVIKCLADADPQVRFQAALTAGALPKPEIVGPLARLAAIQSEDRWTRAAILSSLPGQANAAALLKEIAKKATPAREGLLFLVADLGRQMGAGLTGAESLKGHVQFAHELDSTPLACVIAGEVGFARGAGADFKSIVATDSSRFEGLLGKARAVAEDGTSLVALRGFAIELLAFDDSTDATQLLMGQLSAQQPPDLQRAAVRALVQPGRRRELPALISAEPWNSYTPGVRAMLIDRLAGAPELAGILLSALESGQVPLGSLMPAQREQLRKSKNAELRTRAERLFSASGGDRQEAFVRTKAALALKPSPANGRMVFEKNCAICHRFNQQGIAVGPDLFDIRHQPKETILLHIVIPEAEISPNFVNYECELKDGRTLSGLLAAETSTTLTFRMAQGVEESVVRTQVSRLSASRLSLMPQELEKAMTLQEVADLLGYLRGEE
jgi:putative heme-binding domain-containing protein